MSKAFDRGLGWAYRPASMRKVGGFLFTLALLGAPAFAQLEGSEEADAAADALGSAADAEASGLSNAEKGERSEKMLQDGRAAVARGSTVLSEARAAKDVVQLNCVNEKLTQVKGLLALSEKASIKMYDSMSAGLETEANHEYTKISVAAEKIRSLRSEIEQCVGESSVYTGDTDVEFTDEGEGPKGDPTKTPPPNPAPEMPPVSSTF